MMLEYRLKKKIKYLKYRVNERNRLFFGNVILKLTYNNIFLTLTNLKGLVLGNFTSGMLKGVKGKKKKCSTFVAERLGFILGRKAIYFNFFKLIIKYQNSTSSKLLYSVIKGLKESGVKILKIIRYYPYARNGCRKKKQRRK